jgi:hypothetical protein
MLPISFKETLQGFKDQASAVTAQINGQDKATTRAALADAQRRMAAHPSASRTIYNVLMKSKDESLTIDTLDEARLEKELGADYLSQFDHDAS